MRLFPFLTVLALANLAASPGALAETINSFERTQTLMVPSDILGEAREIHVRLPVGFSEDRDYPVVYVLDSEWNFEIVAAYLDYQAHSGVMPPVIVTGVRNVNRNRDYLPAVDADFPDSGGAHAFLSFVEREWIGAVEAAFPASAERVLIGHSFGGVFTLFSFFENPALFDAYLAISASAWISDRILFSMAAERLADEAGLDDRFVFMAPGAYDGGPTLSSGEGLAALFEADAPASLDWSFYVVPEADHFKAFTSGMDEGLKRLFPAVGFADEARAAGQGGGAQGVRRWFREKSRELEFRFHPSWFDFGVAAINLSRDGHHEAAAELIAQTREHHREHAHLEAFAGQVHENAGNLRDARRAYERAIEITKADGLHPNAIHLNRLNAGLDRIDAGIADAAHGDD